ncbi:MAG TPA: Holliday junction resolvase-like protein [Acidobacteriota bacterium]|nr:Holliday junction resolvase-like protein [Acidobacteriota bacterium]
MSLANLLFLAVATAAVAALGLLGWRYSRLLERLDGERLEWRREAHRQAWEEARARFHQWQQEELENQRRAIRQVEEQRADNLLQAYKRQAERRIRQDAITRSGSVLRGQAAEHLAPYLPEFRFLPNEARFLGSPVDFVVFEGLSQARCERVVLVEVKSGKSSLSTRERRVRDAVRQGRVEWEEVRLPHGAPPDNPPQGVGEPDGPRSPVIVEPPAE